MMPLAQRAESINAMNKTISWFTSTTSRLVFLLIALSAWPWSLVSIRAVGHWSSAGQSMQDTRMSFKNLLSGSGKTKDGSSFSFSVSEASDGIKVSARTEKRRSVSRAKAVLKRTLRGTEIRERGPKLNDGGKKVGERVLARLTSNGRDKIRYVVLWTEGSDFHYLESVSLPHILAFEREYYR